MDHSHQSESNENIVCPYLGMIDDPDSLFGYPHSLNFCYRANPVQPVNLVYQQGVCLNRSYKTCKIFDRPWQGKMPPEIGSTENKFFRKNLLANRFFTAFMVVIGLLIAGYIISQIYISNSSSTINPSPTPSPSPTQAPPSPTTKPSATPPNRTSTIQPTITPLNTITPTASLIPTMTLGPNLYTPYGTTTIYLLHQVKIGESLYTIANQYQTSNEVIQASNFIEQGASVRPDDILVILPGELDPSKTQKYIAISLTKPEQLTQLAEEHQVSADELREINNLGPGNIIPAGRWLIIPLRSIK